MNTVFFDSTVNDDVRRWNLYNGDIFVFSPCEASIALCKFCPRHGSGGIRHIEPRKKRSTGYRLKSMRLSLPSLNRHSSTTRVQKLLGEMKCDLKKAHFDVPRMRTSPSGDYLTTGIAYALASSS